MATDETTTEAPTGYVENPDHVPNPTDMYGTLDTSGTAGAAHGRIDEVTPIFEKARQDDLALAARALDPDDDGVDRSMVTLPQGQNIVPVDPEAEAKRVKSAADAAAGQDVDLTSSRMTPPKQEAAASGPAAAETAEAQQSEQGAGSGATDGGGKPASASSSSSASASSSSSDKDKDAKSEK